MNSKQKINNIVSVLYRRC